MSRASLLVAIAPLVSLLAASRAEAYDSFAQPCTTRPFFCARAPIDFERTDALPIEFDFDTGWVPQNSPLSVRLAAGVFANTHVALAGDLVTSWPRALTLKVPGERDASAFDFHYGAEFSAEGQLDIEVLGSHYTWQGDIPFIPQVDFQVEAEKAFTAWAFSPGVELSSTTLPQRVASVGLSDIIGASIPGLDGGFALDVAIELTAKYTTQRVVVQTPDKKPVGSGPFTEDGSVVLASFEGGPNVEYDVHPEGTVHYEGTIHLVPTFYIELLGSDYSIPIADIPIDFPITTTDWKFDPKRVHVPLPDLRLEVEEIDFGDVKVGKGKTLPFDLENTGEATLHLDLATNDAAFVVEDETKDVERETAFASAVRFSPKKEGPFEAVLQVASNDPLERVRTVVLRGIGKDVGGDEDGDADDGAGISDPAGCGCRVGDSSRDGDALWLAAAAAFAAVVRMKRTRRR